MFRKSVLISTLAAASFILSACAARTAAPSGEIAVAPEVQPTAVAVEAAVVIENVEPTAQISESAQPAVEVQPTVEIVQQPAPAAPDQSLAIDPVSGLSVLEIQDLAFMREEEKLARDVYLVLFNTTGIQVFQNIAASEQTHMDTIKGLLDTYGLADPAAGMAAGEFNDPALQSLYDQLVAQGSQSVAEALKVGAAIEEIDILDLEKRLAQTDQADIQLAYQNLETGSENHLRAFTGRLLSQVGETYQPQYLSLDVYNAIIASSSGNGNGASGGNGYRGGNRP